MEFNKKTHGCAEVRGSLSELYDSLMNMGEEIYRLTKEPQMLLTENVSIEIKPNRKEG